MNTFAVFEIIDYHNFFFKIYLIDLHEVVVNYFLNNEVNKHHELQPDLYYFPGTCLERRQKIYNRHERF